MNQHVITYINHIGALCGQMFIKDEMSQEMYMTKVEQFNEALESEMELITGNIIERMRRGETCAS